MKRRNFIGGLLSVGGLMTVGVATSSSIQTNIESPKLYSEPFYEFFKHFNGSDISFNQHILYQNYIRGDRVITVGRQKYGCSTLLLTLAAWESSASTKNPHWSGKDSCCFVSDNCNLSNLLRIKMKDKEKELGMKFPIHFAHSNEELTTSTYSFIAFDGHDNLPKTYGGRFFALKTTEL